MACSGRKNSLRGAFSSRSSHQLVFYQLINSFVMRSARRATDTFSLFDLIKIPDLQQQSPRRDLTEHPLFSSRWLRDRWVVHPLFWILYTSFFALAGGDTFLSALRYEMLLLPVKMMVVYLTIYLLIPHLFLQGRYWAFFLSLTFLLILGGLLQRGVIYYVLYPRLYSSEPYGELINVYWILKNSLSIFTVTVLASSVKITKYWYEDHQKAKALREEKLEAELNFLKAQIHPHFLFNTLNNLYSLTLQRSPAAPEVVLRLSELMSYLLYDASAALVPLSREIETMHSYIALERIRHGTSLDLFFEITGEVEGIHIGPLLLLPFVENSFKHGVSEVIEKKWIALHLAVKADSLLFKVENSRSRGPVNPHQADHTGGIGLRNVKRRLELLYPERHELKIFEEEDSYLITLKMKLTA